jgi:hypothetical protein
LGRLARLVRKCRPVYPVAAIIVGVDVAVAAGAPALADSLKSPSWLQVGAAVIAVTTFLGVWLMERDATGVPDRNPMHDAIAAAFVVTYLVSVAWAAFMFFSSDVKISSLASTLVQNFTVLTGVVVGGHFSADTVKRVAQIRAQGPGPSTGPADDGTQ